MLKRDVMAIVAGTLLMAGPALAANGWVVRVCRGATEASAIRVEANEEGHQVELLTNWQSDTVTTDFPLQASMANVTRVHVVADSEPADGKVAMCVLHNGKVVKAMNFKDLLSVTASSTGHDSKCKCAKSGAQ